MLELCQRRGQRHGQLSKRAAAAAEVAQVERLFGRGEEREQIADGLRDLTTLTINTGEMRSNGLRNVSFYAGVLI